MSGPTRAQLLAEQADADAAITQLQTELDASRSRVAELERAVLAATATTDALTQAQAQRDALQAEIDRLRADRPVPSWVAVYAKAVRGALVAAIPTAVSVLGDGHLSLPDAGLIAAAVLGVGGVVAQTRNATRTAP